MADLMVRRGVGAPVADVDPFRLMRDQVRRMQDMFRWDPYAELDSPAFGAPAVFVPDVEVRDTRDAIVFTADLPGVCQEDLDITVIGNRLRLSGKREQERVNEGDTWYTAERSFGSFIRSFVLPEGVDTDSVTARLESGVLTISVNKQVAVQPRRIAVEQARPAASSSATDKAAPATARPSTRVPEKV